MKRGLLVVCALFLLVAAPVSADDMPAHGSPLIHLKNGTSSNWSGYAVETKLTNPQSNAVSDVKGTWTVPTVTCTSRNTYSSSWVGIDGYSDNSVEQTGTEADCNNGKPSYYAWYEMYPKFPAMIPLAITAGATVSAEVKYINTNEFQLTLSVNGTTYTTIQKARAKRQSAEWIVEAPSSGSVLPLANFGTTGITNAYATLNGVVGSINNKAWVFDPITMVNPSGATATPSVLSPDGASFTVTYAQ